MSNFAACQQARHRPLHKAVTPAGIIGHRPTARDSRTPLTTRGLTDRTS